jgi:cytochrome bd-type quinol oxidase subunit 2
MCNYILQNIIFLFIIFIYIYFVLGFKFRKSDFDYRKYYKKRKKESTWSWFTDINGWQAAIFSLIFTIIYFFLKRGVLTDILGIFSIDLCKIG